MYTNKSINYRSSFNAKESSLAFITSLLLPSLVAIAVLILVTIFSVFGGFDAEKVIYSEAGKIATILITPTVFFYIYYFMARQSKIDVFEASDINFKINWLKVITVAIMAVVCVFLISPFITLIEYLYSLVGYNPESELPFVMNSGAKLVIGIIIMAVVPALCEELLFRGLIFKGLQGKLGPHKAIVLSALMFTLLHGNLQQTVYQFILGMILGYAMYYGKSLIYPVLLHFINNLIVVISSYIYTKRNIDINADPIYTSTWEYLQPVVLFVFAMALVIGLIYFLKYLNKLEVKYGSDSSRRKKSGVKLVKIKKTETIIENQNIIDSNGGQGVYNNKFLTKSESLLIWGSVGLGFVLWVSQTVMQFYSLV